MKSIRNLSLQFMALLVAGGCLVLAGGLLSFSAVAEYRVFALRVVEDLLVNEDEAAEDNGDGPAEVRVIRQVATTLDPLQYVEYNPLNAGERVEYLDSWMCWGSTAHFAPPCPKPDPAPEPALGPGDQGPVEEAN